jgi:hypothetical protein
MSFAFGSSLLLISKPSPDSFLVLKSKKKQAAPIYLLVHLKRVLVLVVVTAILSAGSLFSDQ